MYLEVYKDLIKFRHKFLLRGFGKIFLLSCQADSMEPMYAAFGGEEKYWEYIREDIRNSAIIEKFFVDKEKEYSSLEEDKSWEEEQQQLIEELIREQNVKIVK